MRDHDRRDPERLHLLAHESREHADAMGIEPHARLVEEQQLAPAREHARDSHALRLPARELGHGRAGRGERAIEPDPCEPVGGVVIAAGVAKRELEVPAHVEVVEQRAALRDEAELRPIERERRGHDVEASALELVALEQYARERALAGAGPAEEDHDLARRDVEIDAIDEHAAVGKRDPQPADREVWRGPHAHQYTGTAARQRSALAVAGFL